MADTAQGVAVGIDLGTTFSCVGVWKNDGVEIIANDQGNRTTPSYVAFTDSEKLVGEAAYNQAAANSENTVFAVKRLIGKNFSDEVVQKERQFWPFKVVQKGRDKPAIQVQYMGEQKEFYPEEISAMVLTKMKQTASDYLGQEVTDAVITVPAYFSDSQRVSTKNAGEIAGLKVLRIINEPTAAAMAYGLHKKMTKEQTVLIFDWGGGTLDCTVLTLDEGIFEVKATNGDTHLGGEDVDNILTKYFAQEFKRKHKIDLSDNNRALRRLRTGCEKMKRALSSGSQADLNIDSLCEGIDFHSKITRARFEELCGDLFRRCMTPVEQVLKDAGVEKSAIDEVVLVGGSTRIPKIQKMIEDFFGKAPNKSIHPDEAIAYGAAVQAAIIAGTATGAAKDCLLLDVTPLSLGVESAGGVMAVLIPRNTTIPTERTKMFSTNRDNQTDVTIKVFEGERHKTADNNPLGSFKLENIPAMARGQPQIEVKFALDSNGILICTALEKSSNASANITITSQDRMSEADIERMLEVAERFAEDDRRVRETLEWRNGLETYVYNVKDKMNEEEMKAEMTAEETASLQAAVEKVIEFLYDDPKNLEEIKAMQKELETANNAVTTRVYNIIAQKRADKEFEEHKKQQQAQQEAGEQGGQPGGPPPAEDID